MICIDKHCKREYPINLPKCPYCGASNPYYQDISKKLEQERRLLEQKLQEEKQLEKESDGKYVSPLRILVEGGNVDAENDDIREAILPITYYLGVFSILILVAVLTLHFIPTFENKEWIQLGFTFSISGILLFVSQLVNALLKTKDFPVQAANGEKPDSLSTLNGIGYSLIGGFRTVEDTHVSYVFLCLFIPLFPVGCYRVKEGNFKSFRDGVYRKTTTDVQCMGSEKWRILEIIQVYLSSYSIMAIIICIVWLMSLIF